VQNIDKQKEKLEQKKNRLVLEEIKLKLKERKARTRHLIEVGGVVAKAGLDHLSTNTLYGALRSIKETMDNDSSVLTKWTKIGDELFSAEQDIFTSVIISFESQPDKTIRDQIRLQGLRWNKFRQEWYGSVKCIDSLKKCISATPHNIEILDIHSIKG